MSNTLATFLDINLSGRGNRLFLFSCLARVRTETDHFIASMTLFLGIVNNVIEHQVYGSLSSGQQSAPLLFWIIIFGNTMWVYQNLWSF